MNNCSLYYKIINTLRVLSVDMVNNSNSGHPGNYNFYCSII